MFKFGNKGSGEEKLLLIIAEWPRIKKAGNFQLFCFLILE